MRRPAAFAPSALVLSFPFAGRVQPAELAWWGAPPARKAQRLELPVRWEGSTWGFVLVVILSERSESKDPVRRFGGFRQAGTPEPSVSQHARCCQGYGFVAGRLYGF
ncbi:hypothetical protein CE91St33_09560 [Eggerthella lenta]|nr:hypothetical protein CE91St33_09560 [Eggerthella lenta]